MQRHLKHFLHLLTAGILSSISACHLAQTPAGCAARVCENFENGSLSAGRESTTGDLSISLRNTFQGRNSLRVRSSGGGHNANYLRIDLRALPELQQILYGRMMVWLDASNSTTGDFTLLQAVGPAKQASGAPAATRVMYRARIDGRHDHLMANYDTRVDGEVDSDWTTDCWKHPGADGNKPPAPEYRLTANAWHCVQWYFNSADNEMALWLNGNPLTDLHVRGRGDGCVGHSQMDAWYAPAKFQEIDLGMEQYHRNTKPRELYIDNIALDNTPVPCPQE